VNKTNQFNVTTRRYTEAQICAISRDPQGWAGAFHLTDRMANYGLIGVLLCRPAGVSGVWEIDTWLMSCRALGRQMEKFMFDRLIEAAIARQVRQLLGTFCPTSKNGLVKDLYDQMGFRRIFEGTDQIRYEFNVPSVPTLTASHIRNATA
jgi:FkbH-like protein